MAKKPKKAKPRYKTFSAEEMLEWNKAELIKEYNKTAERHNKRITRARARGITPAATGRRRSRLSSKTKISKQEMVKRIQEMNASDITVAGMIDDIARMYGNQTKAFKDQLNQLLKEEPGVFSSIYQKYRELMVGIKTGKFTDWRAIYYETLSYAVETKEIRWYYPDDKRGTIWDERPNYNEEEILQRYRIMLGKELDRALERILKNANPNVTA